MTKAQMQARLDSFMATGTPKATSAAGFLFANANTPAIQVSPLPEHQTPRVRKPVLVTFEVKVPDPTRGQSFAPYKVMRVRNQASGKYAVDKSYGEDYYTAIVAAILAHGPTL